MAVSRDRLLRDGIFAAGLALLLGLFAAGVVGMAWGDGDQGSIRVEALGAGAGAAQNDVLLLPGGATREAVARLHLQLPPPDANRSRWVVWLGRDPVDAVRLQRPAAGGVAWRSPDYDFFRPGDTRSRLPAGFAFPLPGDWQGPIVLELHARGAVRSALHPRLLRESDAVGLASMAVALNAAAYAGLFMLALIVLVLYAVTRERSFVAAFVCAGAGLLFLVARNGHLFQLPVFDLLAGWRSQAIWALLLLFAASLVQLLLRYASLRGGSAPLARLFEGYAYALVALAALCLLDLPPLRPWMQPLALLVVAGTGIGGVVILGDAVRRRLALSGWILVLALLTLGAVAANEAMARGWLADLLWTRYGYQVGTVATLALLSLSLFSRIGEYRDQRDRDHLARVDSERRMAREAARNALTLALRTRLRDQAVADIEWTAARLLLEHLLPQVPTTTAAVVAHDYHDQHLLMVEPAQRKQALADDIAARSLPLKRLAAQGVPLQQPLAQAAGAATEALVPLPVRAPGWGLLLLQRAGEEGFSTEELALAGEFARLATLHVDETLAAEQLRRSAELDALTGAFNRRSIDQWLARAFLDASRRQQALSLLFIDIDRFKSVNDRLGHAGGDHCLRAVAAALRGALEDGDLLGRYGGEEFVALLPGRAGADAREMGERLRAAVERSEIEYEGRAEKVTVSIGVATRLERESTPAAAIERADKALYAAKRGGRNCVHVAPAMFT
ncbi:GGDEF domain-containing protein [Cognatiluteimonas weifangensis]|uniref:diguanylate cyclase n=1 Tax=Cognatiluteimonas weifangensis TaxID=2303539 RepID=A0A372DJZ3_9GAMM|nr:GGDEF domain-containing protein [Luteimonas weifangensis]RFP59814.1 diguanylate cyclase [Luteimonas weifangensis]